MVFNYVNFNLSMFDLLLLIMTSILYTDHQKIQISLHLDEDYAWRRQPPCYRHCHCTISEHPLVVEFAECHEDGVVI